MIFSLLHNYLQTAQRFEFLKLQEEGGMDVFVRIGPYIKMFTLAVPKSLPPNKTLCRFVNVMPGKSEYVALSCKSNANEEVCLLKFSIQSI
jgi:hypothetical protein